MRTFTTTASVTIAFGILALNKDQSDRRSTCLCAMGDGRFNIIQPVQFKAGETFGYDGEIPKAIANSLEEQTSSGEKALEDLDRSQLFVIARQVGLSPAGNIGTAKLIETIRAKQEADAKANRIAELEAKGEARTEEETAELAALKG